MAYFFYFLSGAYAEWINVHPGVLGCIIPLLLMGLQNTEVSVAATFALKDITRDCYSSLQPFGEQILHSCMVYYIVYWIEFCLFFSFMS